MRWFKHMTDASDDEFLVQLESEFGLEGYARWWKLLEAVASHMDGTKRTSAAYPWSKWCLILRAKREKLGRFLEHLANQHRINLKQTGDILEISVPKLLKFRDEYSRKSGHSPDKVAPDTETDIPPTEGAHRPPPPKPSEAATPQQQGMRAALEALQPYGLHKPDPPKRRFLALMVRDFGGDAVVAVIHELGDSLLAANNPWQYLKGALEQRRVGLPPARAAPKASTTPQRRPPNEQQQFFDQQLRRKEPA